jgi:HlyD family secretion protein
MTLVNFELWSQMERAMKRTMLYVILGVVAVAVAVAAVAGVIVLRLRGAAQSEEEMRIAVAERGPMQVVVLASGVIEPAAHVSLDFETPGRVADVRVEVGDRVKVGDVLARLDTRQLELQVLQAQAALDLAVVQLAELENGPRAEDVASAEANLRAAQAQVSAATANYNQLKDGPGAAQIAGAEAQLASVRLQYELALDAWDRLRGEKGREREKEQADYDLYVAREALEAAQAELDDLLAGTDADEIRAAQANVSAAVAQQDASQAQLDLVLAGPTEEQMADAEAQVAQAEAALALAELTLERATLRAPFDGIVAAVNVKAGEIGSGVFPAITVLDGSGFRTTISVDELDVGRLARGQKAVVTLEALPDAEIPGTVERIAPVATMEGGVVYYDVVVSLGVTDAPVRADMSANTTILVNEYADVLKIPTWVVRVDQDTGQTYVDRRAGGEIERVDVTLGIRYEGFVQVLGGLAEGDELVLISDPARFGPPGE